MKLGVFIGLDQTKPNRVELKTEQRQSHSRRTESNMFGLDQIRLEKIGPD